MADTVCTGCGQADEAPKHRILINAQHDEEAWHYDCHSSTLRGCAICESVVAAHPDKKDAELGQALLTNFPIVESPQPTAPAVGPVLDATTSTEG